MDVLGIGSLSIRGLKLFSRNLLGAAAMVIGWCIIVCRCSVCSSSAGKTSRRQRDPNINRYDKDILPVYYWNINLIGIPCFN
ncbi:hypothetical protein OAL47_02785 [Verrucomicrobia bacterium]|nr:hypothetical protein [Verrucomicrobiota bacterium]